MAHSWEKFAQDYTAEQTLRPDGRGLRMRLRYSGDWYQWCEPTPALRRRKALYAAALLADAVLFGFAGTRAAAVNTAPAVAAAGLLSLICLLFEGIGVVQFCLTQRKVRKPDCLEIHTKIKAAAFLRALCMAAALLASAVLQLRGGFSAAGAAAAAGYAGCAALSAGVYLAQHRLAVRLLPGDGSLFTAENEDRWAEIEAELRPAPAAPCAAEPAPETEA